MKIWKCPLKTDKIDENREKNDFFSIDDIWMSYKTREHFAVEKGWNFTQKQFESSFYWMETRNGSVQSYQAKL